MIRIGILAIFGLFRAVGCMAETGVLVEIPGLWAGFAAGPVARVTGNFSHADLNGDGLPDLLLDRGAWIRDMGAGWARTVPLPGGNDGGAYDVDREGILWTATRDGITGWRLNASGEAWEQVGKPSPVRFLEDRDPGPEQAFPRRPMLRDVDGDGRDDLIVMTARGVCWHHREPDGFNPRAVLLVPLPESRVAYPGSAPLWPPEQRALALPVFRFSGEASLSPEDVTVAHTENTATGTLWTIRRYPILREGGPVRVGTAATTASPPLPEDALPVWLDRGGARPGFARVYREADGAGTPGGAVMACAVWEADARTPRLFRRPAPPGTALYPPLSDINGDGRLDVAILTVGLTRRGPRDPAQELLTGNRLTVEVSVWPRREGGLYDRDPSWKATRTVQLDAPPIRQPRMLRKAAPGQLASLHGDFNGDGHADLLVRERLDLVGCYPCGPEGCGHQPLFTLAVSPDETVVPADVNGDGLADVVRIPEMDGAPTRVFLTGAGGP